MARTLFPAHVCERSDPAGRADAGDAVGGDDAAGAGRARRPIRSTGRGSATVLSDLVLRGAGERDSRALTDYLDSLGLQRSSSVGVHHTRFGCAALAAKVMEGLAIYADIVRRPHLPETGFEAARDLALQALAGIDDEPRQKLMIKLREWHLPSPVRPQLDGARRTTWRS